MEVALLGNLSEFFLDFSRKYKWSPYCIVSLAGLTMAWFAQIVLVRNGVPSDPVLPLLVLVLSCTGLFVAVLNILTYLANLIFGLDNLTARSYLCLTFVPFFLLWPYIAILEHLQDSDVDIGGSGLSTKSIYQFLFIFLYVLIGLIVMLSMNKHEERKGPNNIRKRVTCVLMNSAFGLAAVACGFGLYDHFLFREVGKELSEYEINGEMRSVIICPISSDITMALNVSGPSILHSGFGFTDEMLDNHHPNGLSCELTVSRPPQPSRILVDRLIDDSSQPGWREGALPLEASEQPLELRMTVGREESSFFSKLLDPAIYYLRILSLSKFSFDVSHRAVFWIQPRVVGEIGSSEASVILIGFDALRADHLSSYGYPRNTTPHIDKFAETAVVFSNCRSTSPWTLPSFFSIMTSTYPSVHQYGTNIRGVYANQFRIGNIWEVGKIYPDYSINTLAETLRKHGYYTAAFTNNHFLSPEFEFTRGFIEFNRYEPTAKTGVDRAIRWLNRHGKEKFFLFVHIMDPHDYSDDYIDESFLGQKLKAFGNQDEGGIQRDINRYDGKIHFADEHVGRLLEAVDELLPDGSMIALTSDHGEEFLDHGSHRHGRSLYKELIHVPLLLRLPGWTHAGEIIEESSSTLDIAPTILDFLNLPLPPFYEGQTLLPLVRGSTSPARQIHAEALNFGHERKGLIMYPHKLIYTMTADTLELYDLDEDPGENRNIIGKAPEVESQMRQSLQSFLVRSNRGFEVMLSPSPERHTYEGRLITKGTFIKVMPLSLEGVSVFRVNQKASEIHFTLGPGDESRGFGFDVDPSDAIIRLELKEQEDYPPINVCLGSDEGDRQAAPLEFSKVELEQPNGYQQSGLKNEGIHILSRGHEAKSKTVSIDKKTKEDLEALGYLE